MRPVRRLLLAAAPVLLLVGPLCGVAYAHVEASADGATRGGAGTVTFAAEAEEKTPMTKVEIALPGDTPLLGVTVPAKDGWASAVTAAAPAVPTTDGGAPATEVVSRVTWTATAGGIAPEEKGEFPIQVGRFPDTGRVAFKALVTYADGTVVSWIEQQAPGSPEPEQPAPVLDLAPGNAAPAGATAAAEPSAMAMAVTAEPTAEPTPVAQAPDPGTSTGTAVTLVVLGLLAALGAGAAVRAHSRRGAGTR